MARRPATAEGKARYQRRLANAIAAGKTRQQARGHKAGEAKARRLRETASGGLTTRQRGEVKAFAVRQAGRDGRSEDRAAADLLSWTLRRGWDAFKALRAEQRLAAKMGIMPQGWLEATIADLGGDDDDPPEKFWLYYH